MDMIIGNLNEISDVQAQDAWVEYDGLTEMEMTALLRKVIEKQLEKEEQAGLCPEEFSDGQDDVGYSPIQNSLDEDKFNQLVELQIRMKRGMEEFIIPMGQNKDNAVLFYQEKKAAFEKAKEYLNGYSKKNNGIEGFQYWDKFNQLKSERDYSYLALKGCQNKLSKYWDTWNNLKNEAMDLVGDNKALWGKFFGEFQVPETFKKKVGDHHFFMVSGTKLDLELPVPQDEDYLLWVGFDSEEIDGQDVMKMSQGDQMEELLISHLREEALLEMEGSNNPGNLWKLNEYLENKKVSVEFSEFYQEEEAEDMINLMETCPF